MPQVCSDAPRSSGELLESEENTFGPLKDSSSLLANPGELRDSLESDGYLYLKNFFTRKDVLEVRKGILARLHEQDLLLPSRDPLEARANPDQRTSFMPELAADNPALEKLIYGERVMSFYESLLQGEVLHYDFTWFRPVWVRAVERRPIVIWSTWDVELNRSSRCGCPTVTYLCDSED
jgi:hypothetical protein